MAVIFDDTVCLATSQDTIYFASAATRDDSPQSPHMLVLGRSQRFPTNMEAITWTIISSTPTTYFDPASKAGRSSGVPICSVSNDGVFTLRHWPSRLDGHDVLLGFRYDPRIERRKKSQTCNAITPEFGDWERVDLLTPDDVTTYEKIIIPPEASDLASSSGDNTFVRGDARVVFFSSNGGIRYAWFNSTSHLNKIYSHELTEIVPPSAVVHLESVAYGDGQLYIIQCTLYQDQVLNVIKCNRTLLILPFTASYPSSPGKEFVTGWNVDCGFGTVLAKAVNGKLYSTCSANETTSNLYVFDSKTSARRGPVKLVEERATRTLFERFYSIDLVYASPLLDEPQFAIIRTPDHDYAVDVHSANETSVNLTSSRMPNFFKGQRLEWTCRTSEQDRWVAIAGAVSGAIAALLLVCTFVWRRRHRARNAGK